MKLPILFIGAQEIIVIILITLLLFGAKAIPDLARSLGKVVREVNKVSEQVKEEIRQTEDTFAKDEKEIQEIINKEEDKTPE